MHFTRLFSTSFWRSRQALYEPYITPLNEEQKKALRKIMAKSLPKYHGRLSKDIRQILEAYNPPESTLICRKQTIESVEKIIKSAFGADYSVIDRSLYTYARDIELAPIELAIHDGSRPRGFSPGTEDQPLPDPYRPDVLAKLLEKHGYKGCFVTGDAQHTLPPEEMKDTKAQKIGVRGPLPLNPPWFSSTPRAESYLTYPPTLYAEHISNATLPFFLSPPMPTYLPLARLLRAYCSMNDSLPDLIAFILLWARSIDLPQLTPTCIALMVIVFLQVRRSLPSLQNPKDPEQVKTLAGTDEGVWVRAEWLPRYRPQAFWFETAFISPPDPGTLWPRKTGSLLYEFFQFWCQGSTAADFSSQSLSVRAGAALPRVPVTSDTGAVLQRDQATDEMISRGIVPWLPTSEPIMWQTQPIVVPDPFIHPYNHARNISKSAASYLHYSSSLSHRTLFRGHPMARVLGPHLPPPKGGIRQSLRFRAYSTGSLGDHAKELYESMLPPSDILAARARTIARVEKVIKNKFGPSYSLESFGSTRYGVSSATSDLDLVIIDPQRPNGFSPNVHISRLPNVYDTMVVARAISMDGFAEVFAIPKATVPIVKFRDPNTGLECDLNTNDQLGLWNTLLIQSYCDLAPELVRPMVMIIKQWAKSHGLNDPSGQHGPVTFSSYALVLMVVGFLQVRGVLPNLQAGLAPLPKGATEGVFWTRRKKKEGPSRCDIRFSRGEGWKSEVRMQLNEALRGWFTFWAQEHDYDGQIMHIQAGGTLKKAKRPPKKKAKKAKKAKAISSLELQEHTRQQEEDVAVTAWQSQNQNEGDKSPESPEDTKREDSKDIHVTMEGIPPDTLIHDLRSELHVDQGGMETLERPASISPNEEPPTQLDRYVELPGAEQPSTWGPNALVVVDPFIHHKNVCGSITKGKIELFKAECQRSVVVMDLGGGLGDIMGEVQSLPGAVIRGRSRRRGITLARGKGNGRGR